jgi:cyclic pyranopterin phosphate synthase
MADTTSPTPLNPPSRGPVDRLGRPLHDLRISVMDRCNFRCPYCMPADQYHENFRFLHSNERLSFQEIVRLTRLFVRLGVRKIRITGGEPLLRPDIGELVGELSLIDDIEDIALTTNGVLLAQHAAGLKAAGLHRVTVSLDSIDDEVFQRMTGGRGGLERVLDGIRAASDAGLDPVKLNVVVQRGVNDEGVLNLVDHFRGTGVVVRFIEYMDVGTMNHWRPEDTVPSRELLERIGGRFAVTPVDRSYRGEVAERYEYEDGAGEIGFVSSVTEPFCRDCTRARLSSDGKLFNCLFANRGLDLRAAVRGGVDDEELLEIIYRAWRDRADRYSELRASLRSSPEELKRIEMYYIGG